MNSTSKWYKDWFNTTYYHLLYNKRDYKEAQNFMAHLTDYLNLNKGDHILDLACGKGRHSIYLNSLGYIVTGVDLSENSIAEANKFSNKTLHFRVHDMRNTFINKYDAILNLFTSFGYFEDDNEDIKVLKNIKNGLKPNGIAVIDYLNVTKSIANIIPHETQQRGNIKFDIKRFVSDNFINKDIKFKDNDTDYFFTEHVKCLNFDKFKNYLNKVDMKLIDCFGDYDLNPFNKENSDRLILVIK